MNQSTSWLQRRMSRNALPVTEPFDRQENRRTLRWSVLVLRVFLGQRSSGRLPFRPVREHRGVAVGPYPPQPIPTVFVMVDQKRCPAVGVQVCQTLQSVGRLWLVVDHVHQDGSEYRESDMAPDEVDRQIL